MEREPLDGVRVTLADDDNLFRWQIAIFGPPDTLFTGGYYKVRHRSATHSYVAISAKESPHAEVMPARE